MLLSDGARQDVVDDGDAQQYGEPISGLGEDMPSASSPLVIDHRSGAGDRLYARFRSDGSNHGEMW